MNDIQGIFCTNIQRNHYCKANLSFSISFTVFFPPSPVTVDTVTFKEHIFESDIRGVTLQGIIFTLSA